MLRAWWGERVAVGRSRGDSPEILEGWRCQALVTGIVFRVGKG